MKKLYALAAIAFSVIAAQAQTKNVGINTNTPGSTLDVIGSIAAPYATQGGSYTLTASDHYEVYTGGAGSTFTLPAALAIGSGNFKGREYIIKNAGSADLTIAANGTELIDGSAIITLLAGYTTTLVSTGATGAVTTWSVKGTEGSAGSNPSGWTTTGNAGTVPGTNFVGTTDNQGLAFRTFNTERMRIDASGNVGIGLNPLAYLDITGTNAGTNSLQLRSGNSSASSTSNQILFGYNNTTNYRHALKTRHNSGGTSGNALDFYLWNQGTDAAGTAGTKPVMTIDGNWKGMVGIGTTTPKSELHITDGSASLKTVTDAGGYGASLLITDNAIPRIYFEDASQPANKKLMDISLLGQYLSIGSLIDDGSAWDHQYILAANRNGNVGINTNAPSSILDLNGALSLRAGTDLTLVNGGAQGGANDNIALTGNYSFYRITGPSGIFSIYGIVPPANADGYILTLENNTDYVMTLKNSAANTPTNGIITMTNADISSLGGSNVRSTVTLQYNKAQGRWLVISTQNFAVSSGSFATHNIINSVGHPVVAVTNGNGQVVGGGDVTIDVVNNDQTHAGVVPAPGSLAANVVWRTDGSGNPQWAVAPEVDGVIGNEVTDATTGGGLVRAGAGTAVSPYTLGLANGSVAGQVFVTGNSPFTPTLQTVSGDATISANGTVKVNAFESATTSVNVSSATAPSAGQVLTATSGSAATWQTPAAGTVTGSGTATQVAFWNTATVLAGNSNLYWDNSNGRLGIGNSSPGVALDVTGGIRTNNGFIANNGGIGTPSIRFTNDANSGFILSGGTAGKIGVVTTNLERFRFNTVGLSINPAGAVADATQALDVTGNAKVTGIYTTGTKGTNLGNDQGGNIELGADNATANTAAATPYIDFHYGTGAAQDYNVRLINDANGVLDLNGQIKITGGAPGAGKVLTSDAAGLATWTAMTAASANAWGLAGSSITASTAAIGAAPNNNWFGTTSNNGIVFGTNNLVRGIMDANGNLGLGTITPSASSKLDISQSSNTTANALNITGTYNNSTNVNTTGLNINTSFTGAGNPGYVYGEQITVAGAGQDTRGLVITTSSTATNYALLVMGGNVGIGTATPGYKLSFNNDGSAIAWGAGYSKIFDNGQLYIETDDNMYFADVSNNIKMYLGTSGTYNGFVGIGTTTPGQMLEVMGNISLPSSSGNKQIYTWAPGDGNWRIGMSAAPGFTRALATSHVEYLTFANGAGQGFALGDNVSGLSAFEVTGSGNSYYSYFRGRVGINTTTPADYLQAGTVVVGNASSRNGDPRIKGTTGGWTRIGSGGGGLSLWGNGNVDADDVPGLFVSSGNLVGIGTTGPAATLDVNGSLNVTGDFVQQQYAVGAPAYTWQGGSYTIFGAQAATLTTHGSQSVVNITAGISYTNNSGAQRDYSIAIWRDATTIVGGMTKTTPSTFKDCATVSVSEVPSAGSHTYYVGLVSNTGVIAASVQGAWVQVVEIKQ